ncbi:MAG TPA: shikimate kinase [Lacipirellulaceae bacterium]|nr:shikimate kinase [Lacipirellulaceae bacterium]
MAELGDLPIFLIGYRGTGKTSVARELADRINYDWVDADDVVERQSGKTIAAIFADEGEEAFRDWETRAVMVLCGKRQTVVALGGGAVLREENRQAICGAGLVVWLTASVDTIVARLYADATTMSRRPNLTSVGGRAEIEAVLASREPLYRQCANLVVDTEGKTAAEVADDIATNF